MSSHPVGHSEIHTLWTLHDVFWPTKQVNPLVTTALTRLRRLKTGITRPCPDSGVTRIAPGALDPSVFPSPLGVQNTARLLKIWAQVVYIFEVGDLSYLWRVRCHPPPSSNPRLHCTLPLVITWIPNGINTFPFLIPWSSTCSGTREGERDEIVLP